MFAAPPYALGAMIGQGPWYLGAFGNPSPLLLSSSNVVSSADDGSSGMRADVDVMDDVDETKPWRLDYALSFSEIPGDFNALSLYFGSADSAYIGVGLYVAAGLGDTLLHLAPDGGFTAPPATLPDPSGTTIIVSIIFDGTNISLEVDGVEIFPPEPFDPSVITLPYPDVEWQITTDTGGITLNGVHFVQP